MLRSILNYLLYFLWLRSVISWMRIWSVLALSMNANVSNSAKATPRKADCPTTTCSWSHRDGPLKYISCIDVWHLIQSLDSLLAADVEHAQTRTRLLFESDISDLKAEQITSAFDGDPRLVMVHESELFGLPAVKLAAKYGLTSSASKYFFGSFTSYSLISSFS